MADESPPPRVLRRHSKFLKPKDIRRVSVNMDETLLIEEIKRELEKFYSDNAKYIKFPNAKQSTLASEAVG